MSAGVALVWDAPRRGVMTTGTGAFLVMAGAATGLTGSWANAPEGGTVCRVGTANEVGQVVSGVNCLGYPWEEKETSQA